MTSESSKNCLTINTILSDLFVFTLFLEYIFIICFFFSLSSKLANFQSVIDKICCSYQDVILIGGKDFETCKTTLLAF